MTERRGTKGLELWCRKMTEGYPGVKIDNMTTSWRDGLAFCAIIHHFRPDLIDFSKLNKDDIYHNNELAFRIAEQYLGIPALLEPEDMVEYTVPDRLSILTYLSQFYQAFAVREGGSPARIAPKRPQSSTDHGIVSPASTSPPTKIAHKGASLRREPCTKCGLPVFIAERLNVGKSLFHRTCFRCARCNSQLTLANYYETENSDYCCEVCPDEEKAMSKTSAQNEVLQRSMSDEEKSANLKIVSNEPDEFSSIFETALENADIEKVRTLSRDFDIANIKFSDNKSVESSDSGNEEYFRKEQSKPPDLPKSLENANSAQSSMQFDSGFPSKDISVKTSFSDNIESHNVVTKESIVKTRMRLFENDKKADVNSKQVPVSPNASIPISITNVDSSLSENEENKHIPQSINGKQFLSGKENSPKKEFLSTLLPEEKINDTTKSSKSFNLETSDISDLKQEENKETNDVILSNKEISKIDEAIEVINKTIKSLQDNEENPNESKVISIEVKNINNESELSENISLQKENEEDQSSNLGPKDISYIDEEEHEGPDNNADIQLKSSSSKNSEKDNIVKDNSVAEANNKNLKFSDTLEENKLTIDNEIVESLNYNVKVKESEPLEAVNTFIQQPEPQKSTSPTKPNLEKPPSYPEELNPFDDETESLPPKPSLNPFGSEDEDDDQMKELLMKPVPRIKKKNKSPTENMEKFNLNPFESDEDEELPPVPVARKKISIPKFNVSPWSDEENNEEINKKPVPLPREQRTPLRSSRDPINLSIYSHNFGGSNSSISSESYGSSRKKRPAPKPPIPSFRDGSNNSSLASTPSHSVPHSPKSTPKYRKDRPAPQPPKFTSTPKINQASSTNNPSTEEKTTKDKVNRDLQINDNVHTTYLNKSTYGKWKRKKGLAPSKPVPQRRTIKCLPMAEIKKELEFIEIQQQGLEKQGVRLEQIIREKCEGTNSVSTSPDDDIPIEVEDLILQLFELVNEKNELFRKQTELMYLRRQQRLEEEHADVEYQIRCLMMQPEASKTDSDKAREEELIQRLVEIVERRNEIVDCLEKDRVREAEEDDSINNHINLFTLNRDNPTEKTNIKVEKPKKEKKKEKDKEKKKSKYKSKEKVDVDKDIDETETNCSTLEKKKKKKFHLF